MSHKADYEVRPTHLLTNTKLISKQNQPKTEEATKQWLIMPLLVALGYDPYSSDIIPEYTLDVGIKKGEKIDYALQINNQPVIIVECKQLDTNLSEKHISQLYRYFTISDVHIAILTNGDDYWFFTDSQKDNVMDLEPYFVVKLSAINDEEINKLCMYSKELVQHTDIAKLVKYERFQTECKELVVGLRYNRIPTWLIDSLMERSGEISDLDKPTLAEYLYTEIQNTFNGFKVDKTIQKKSSLENRMKNNLDKNKKEISRIKLNHEYIYNDYSDGDWKFHKLDYALILGKRYDNISARQLLINTLSELLEKSLVKSNEIMQEEQFRGQYKIGQDKEQVLEVYTILKITIFIFQHHMV